MALDKIQQKAAMHNKGPAMILAGPGSGKTTVITHRILNLIKVYGINPDRILVITFTNMAAKQMQQRFLSMSDEMGNNVNFGTFHAVFFNILKNEYGFNAQSIVKYEEQWRFVKVKLELYGIYVQDENTLIFNIISEIIKVKSTGGNIDEYETDICDECIFKNIYREYEKMLKHDKKVDFEDMMLDTLHMFENDKNVLEYWQNKYDYILVDEFQDACHVQYSIVNYLAGKHHNVFVVGDDDQSIYGFRGANPSVMKDFKEYYEDEIKIYNLNTNYRSTKNIVNTATMLINNNKERFYKDLNAFNDYGDEVEYIEFEKNEEQFEYIYECLIKIDNAAILTRTNGEANYIIKLLENKGIKSKNGVKEKSIFEHWIATDIEAFLNIASGKNKRSDFLRIINKPSRYISRNYFLENEVDIEKIFIRMYQGNQTVLIDNLKVFLNHIKVISIMNPFSAINYIRKVVGYDKYIEDYSKEQNINPHTFFKILDQIQSVSKNCKDYDEWVKITNDRFEQKHDENHNGKVNVCTMHSSKGLEYDTVIIMNVNEGNIPYAKAIKPSEIEEERRLFYVGLTRAKKKLIICNSKDSKKIKNSRFLNEIKMK